MRHSRWSGQVTPRACKALTLDAAQYRGPWFRQPGTITGPDPACSVSSCSERGLATPDAASGMASDTADASLSCHTGISGIHGKASSLANPCHGSGNAQPATCARPCRGRASRHFSRLETSRTAPLAAEVVIAAYARSAAETWRSRFAGFQARLPFASMAWRRRSSSSAATAR